MYKGNIHSPTIILYEKVPVFKYRKDIKIIGTSNCMLPYSKQDKWTKSS